MRTDPETCEILKRKDWDENHDYSEQLDKFIEEHEDVFINNPENAFDLTMSLKRKTGNVVMVSRIKYAGWSWVKV